VLVRRGAEDLRWLGDRARHDLSHCRLGRLLPQHRATVGDERISVARW